MKGEDGVSGVPGRNGPPGMKVRYIPAFVASIFCWLHDIYLYASKTYDKGHTSN